MGLFNSAEKEARIQFKAQLESQQESNESQVAMQMAERGQVAFEPQVSQLILEGNRRFLPWVPDTKNNQLILPEKYTGLIEPYSDEPLSFLNDEEKLLLYDIDATLAENFMYGEKYGFDDKVIRLFNSIVLFRSSFLLGSRTTGKPVKVAKSQYVESSSLIKRDNRPPGQQKFMGLF